MTDPVNIIVSLKSPYASSRKFSIPAIASMLSNDANDAWGSDRTRRVSKDTWQATAKSLSIVSTDVLYQATAALFADHRNLTKVPEWCVWIRRDDPVAQVDTFTVGGNAAGDYKLLIDGVVVASVTADGIISAATIRSNLVTAFNLTNPPQTAAAGGGATGTVTADEAGVSFLLTASSPSNVLTIAHTTPNSGIGDDMDEAVGADGDDSFYIWTETSLSDGVIKECAKFTQLAARRLLFFGQSNTAAIAQDVSTDIFSKLAGLGYGRTSGWYHPRDTEFLAAGVIGRCAAIPVGQINWAHRQIATVAPEPYVLQAGVADILEGKYVNRYDALELGSTLYGWMLDDLYIDQAILKDVIESGLRSRMVQLLQNEDFVEYTDRGAQQVGAEILGYARELERQGALIKESSVIATGKLDDIPSGDQKDRNWPLFKLSTKARGPTNRFRDINVQVQL